MNHNQKTQLQTITIQETKKSLILDSYLDIFSSFDPRPYNERALSDDFLQECKKILMDKNIDGTVLRLLVPEQHRDAHDEEVITKRLHTYFHTQLHNVQKQIQKDVRVWWAFVIGWFILSFVITYLMKVNTSFSYIMTLITVIWEPASWFLIWTWWDKVMQYFTRERETLQFYTHMSHAPIQFHGF